VGTLQLIDENVRFCLNLRFVRIKFNWIELPKVFPMELPRRISNAYMRNTAGDCVDLMRTGATDLPAKPPQGVIEHFRNSAAATTRL
jgi:hypothetical protein